MRPFNIEIFGRDFAFKGNTAASGPTIQEDYLALSESSIEVLDVAAEVGDYIRITNGTMEYSGVISSIERKEGSRLSVSFKPFISLFEAPILFNTDLQGTSTMEAVMAGIVSSYWVNNSDSEQNIEGLEVRTISSTSSWGLNLKSDTEGKHHCIVNFYSVFIVRALEKYGIVFSTSMDWQRKKITLKIGKLSEEIRRIELNLPNILSSSVTIRQTDNTVNKLIVYSTSDYTTNKIYYLHPDGTYNTTNANRIKPVVFEVKGADDSTASFDSAAASVASETFGSIEYNNLIEMKTMADDEMIKPMDMKIGQTVKIISKNKEYVSILTGKKISETVKLTFGTIRLDLTKILRRKI